MWLPICLVLISWAQDLPLLPKGMDIVRSFTKGSGLKQTKDFPLESFAKSGIATDGLLSDTDYVVGPGDIFSIYLSGNQHFPVNSEGFVLLPDLPELSLGGHSLNKAKQKILVHLSKSFDTTRINISLYSMASLKIYVLGEVQNPGLKIVAPLTRLDAILGQAGGFTRNAVRDSILIIRENGDTLFANLLDFFKSGNLKMNPRIRLGDRVYIPTTSYDREHFFLKNETGRLRLPIRNGNTLSDILILASGFNQTIDAQWIRVFRNHSQPMFLTGVEKDNFKPSANDTIEVGAGEKYVFIGGAIMRPGVYEYIPEFSIDDYLFNAGISPLSHQNLKVDIVDSSGELKKLDRHKHILKPGDKIYVRRNSLDVSRDIFTIVASLTGIIISSATLYYTVNAR